MLVQNRERFFKRGAANFKAWLKLSVILRTAAAGSTGQLEEGSKIDLFLQDQSNNYPTAKKFVKCL